MDVIKAITERRSCRKFSQKPVEFEKIMLCLEAAAHAPSAGNLQNWKFIVVLDKSKIRQIAQYAFQQYWMAHAPVIIAVCSYWDKQEKMYGQKGKTLYATQSVAAATENLLLAATSQGLGTCWVSGFDEEPLKRILQIPANVELQAFITMGYAEQQHDQKIVYSLDTFVYFNKYGENFPNYSSEIGDYSVTLAKNAQELKEKTQPLVDQLVNKVKKLGEKVKKK